MEPYHIIIERNIPFTHGLFEKYAQVSYLSAPEITPEVMRTADALMTRTRTKCNASLLEGSRCRIIASATIGLDHVDLDWCKARGIRVENVPGCNAPAVGQYVMAAIIAAYGTDLRGLTLGIIGEGHVGSIVSRWARGLGMKVMACDTPRAEAEGPEKFCSMEDIAREADVITVHTPYTRAGAYPTHHLLSEDFFRKLERKPMIINSARGPITDTPALKRAMDRGQISRAVIDCWEGEPDIDRELLQKAFIATPHIAGYSREGKMRATVMAARAIARALSLPMPQFTEPIPPDAPDTVTVEAITATYNPLDDTATLRANPERFETLRNTYNLRTEPI